MKFLALFVIWCVLFVLSWPVALAVLVLVPLVLVPLAWLIVLPFRLVGICVGAVLALLKSILSARATAWLSWLTMRAKCAE